jgi:uracil-DNA glycosylase
MYDIIDHVRNNPRLTNWRIFFDQVHDELVSIQDTLNRQYKSSDIAPRIKDLFRVFELTNPEDIKVVIFGQDPYVTYINNEPIATGVAFSVHSDKLTPSLRNIFKEIDNEFDCDVLDNKKKKGIELGNLEEWCREGVLLLNASLTIDAKHEKEAKRKIWHGFLYRLIDYLTELNEDLIYLIWGRNAIKLIDELKITGVTLISSHPSPLSANKSCGEYPSFFESDVFIKCNELLKSFDEKPINWCSN